MIRSAFLFLIGLAACVVLAPGGRCAVAPTAGWPALVAGAAPLPDPVPIRRLRVTEAQLGALRKKAEPGPLVRMTRAEFERRVRAAAEAVRDRALPVRLIEAKYVASLGDSDITGTAAWTLENPNPRAAAYVPDDLHIALTKARWADGTPAVFGLLGPGFPASPALWVEPGQQVLALDWSAMGTAEPGERRFELRVPPALSASLELELPDNSIAVASGPDVLLTGPFPSRNSGRKLWRFRFGAGSRFEFAVRAAGTSPTPRDPVRASLVARYDLEATQTQSSFEYDLEPVRGSVTEWLFDVDPGVRILDAVATDRAGWQTEPPAMAGGPTLLRVRLRQPGPGGKVLITALAAPPDAANPDLPLPMIRPRNGRVGDERLHVRIAPDLKPSGWTNGDYRLLGTSTEADRTLTLSFAGTLLPAGSNRAYRRAPGMAVVGVAPEYETRESLEWRIESGRPVLDVTMQVRVRRGTLFSLLLQMSPGHSLSRWTSTPEDAVAFAGPAGGTPPAVLVEFQRPISEGQGVELRLEFRSQPVPAAARPESPAKLALPRITPVGAVERIGMFTIVPSPGWQVETRVSGVSRTASEIPYRGQQSEGLLFVAPWSPDWTVVSRTVVTRTEGRLLGSTRMTVRIPSGSVSSMTVLVPEADGNERTWQLLSSENSLLTATAIPLADLHAWLPTLAPLNNGWSRLLAGTLAADGPLTAWRLSFAQPVKGEVELETRAPLRAGFAELSVPLPTLSDCHTQSGTVALDESAAREFRGELPTPRDTRLPVRVALRRSAVSTAVGGWRYESLHQASQVDGSNGTAVVFGGRITAAGGPVLKIALPPGAMAESATIGGRWISPQSAPLADEDGVSVVHLPVPSASVVPFEVRYRLPASLVLGFGRVVSPRPGLPDDPEECERTWRLGPDVSAIDPGAAGTVGEEGTETTIRNGSDALFVVKSPVLMAARIVLSTVILALGWWLSCRPVRPSGRVLLIAIVVFATAGSVDVAVGASHFRWPVLASAAALAMLIFARGRRPAEGTIAGNPRPHGSTKVAVIAGSLVLLVLPAWLHGQAVETVDVYLLDNDEVLVPQSLLARLDAIAQPLRPGVVITAASYTGRSEEGSARVSARFTVRNFFDGTAILALPLGDVRLEELRVGKDAAFPLPLKSDVYGVAIPGSGVHTVTATFTMLVKISGSDREIRFGIPEVPESRLTWTAGGESRQLTAIGWRGQQETDGSTLSLDLGNSRTVNLRWRDGPGLATSASISARQACVWSVGEAEAELIAAFLFTVSQGTANSFRFELPADIELMRVSVRSPDGGSAVVLRDWNVGPDRGGVRPVRVQLQSPLEGRALVILEGVPRQPLTNRPVLKFPRIAGNVSVESGVFGFRADRVAIADLATPGLDGNGADPLTRDFPGVSDLQLPATAAPRTFRAVPGPMPELRPTLRPITRNAAATQDVTWTITPGRRADGTGTLRWAAGEEAVSAVEFDLPAAVRLVELRGAELQGWSATAAGRVQAWFKTGVNEPALEWVGTMTLGPTAKSQEPLTFDPPAARVAGASMATTLKVDPPEGWGVRVERDRGWTALPRAGRGQAYRAESVPAAPPQWVFYPPRVNLPPSTGFGTVEVTSAGVVYRVVRVQPTAKGRPGHYVLRVSDLDPAAVVEPAFPDSVRASPITTTGPVREWDLDEPAGSGEPVRVEVVVRLPLPKDEVEMPGVALEVGGTPPGQAAGVAWLGLVGPKASQWRLRGAAPVPTRWDNARKDWPAEIERLKQANGSLHAPRGPRAAVRLDPIDSDRPAPAAPLPRASAQPSAPQDLTGSGESQPGSTWLTPRLSLAAAWAGGLALVALLAMRFPRSTWPEQIGLLCAIVLLFLGESPLYAVLVVIALRAWDLTLRFRTSAHQPA